MNEQRIQGAVLRWRRSAARMLAPNYTPLGWYECDVLELTKSGYFVEYEIKLSRSDFKADSKKRQDKYVWDRKQRQMRLESTTSKHERLVARDTRGPCRFWFIVPDGMVTVHQLPEWAGLIYAADRGGYVRLQTVKQAPQLHRVKVENADELTRQVHTAMYYRFLEHRTRPS